MGRELFSCVEGGKQRELLSCVEGGGGRGEGVVQLCSPPIRFVTASCVLDYNTVATADKFGNIAVVLSLSPLIVVPHSCFSSPQTRLPADTSDEVDEDPSGSRAIWDRGLLNGASQKVSGLYLEYLCCGYVCVCVCVCVCV